LCTDAHVTLTSRTRMTEKKGGELADSMQLFHREKKIKT